MCMLYFNLKIYSKKQTRSKKGKYWESKLHEYKGTSGRCNHWCVTFVIASVDKNIKVLLGSVMLARAS